MKLRKLDWIITIYGTKLNDWAIYTKHNHYLLTSSFSTFPNNIPGYWQLLKYGGMYQILRFINPKNNET